MNKKRGHHSACSSRDCLASLPHPALSGVPYAVGGLPLNRLHLSPLGWSLPDLSLWKPL